MSRTVTAPLWFMSARQQGGVSLQTEPVRK
jgi:hypothetical protein